MREIKFRAWDKVNNKMVYPCSPKNDTYLVFEETGWFVVDHFTGKNETILISENGELMQYTGLKDSKGVEIYEGDIMSTGHGWSNYTVVFEDGSFCFGNDQPNGADRLSQDRVGRLEIVGNIFESPNKGEVL